MLKAALVAAAILSGLGSAKAQAPGDPMIDFAPGQEWSIRGGAAETRVIIGRIEPFLDDTVIHVSVIGVPIPAGMPGAGNLFDIGHSPFSKAALANSLDELVATGVPPAAHFGDGYAQWEAAHGGVYTVSVAEAIDLVLVTVGQGRRQGP